MSWAVHYSEGNSPRKQPFYSGRQGTTLLEAIHPYRKRLSDQYSCFYGSQSRGLSDLFPGRRCRPSAQTVLAQFTRKCLCFCPAGTKNFVPAFHPPSMPDDPAP